MADRSITLNLAVIFISCAICHQANAASAENISAEQLYEDAFRLIVEGDYGEAYERLGEMIARYPGTVYARFAEDRRRRLEELNRAIRRKKIDQSGRIESIVFSTLYSTWLGIGTARLANAESEKAIAAGMMIGAPAGLLTSLTLTRNARLSKGQAALVNFSGYWGTWQGYGLAILLDRNDDEKTMISSAMAGGLLGILTTSALTRKIDLSSGDAGIINYGGLWGTWLSLCTGIIANADEDSDKLLRLLLTGGNLGAGAMAAIAPKIEVSLMRASLINLSGIVGTMIAGGLLLITQPDDEESIFGTLMSGGIIGLLAGGFGTAGLDARDTSKEQRHAKAGFDALSIQPEDSRPASACIITGRCQEITSKELQVDLLSIRF
jgi:hypothetical protein